MLSEALLIILIYIYIYKEGYETLEKQWTAILGAHHPITSEERGTQTLTFYMKFESHFQ